MTAKLNSKIGYILALDQLGFSAKTANDISTLTVALPLWLAAAKEILANLPTDVYFSWASDTWFLQHQDVSVIYRVIDKVFPALFKSKVYLRGALVRGRFYDLSIWPYFATLNKTKNFYCAPLMGAGITRGRVIESASIKGIRIFVDVSTVLRRPEKAVEIADSEHQQMKKKLSHIYGWDVSQSFLPSLVDYPWWKDDYEAILKETQSRMQKSKIPYEIEQLEGLQNAIERWVEYETK